MSLSYYFRLVYWSLTPEQQPGSYRGDYDNDDGDDDDGHLSYIIQLYNI